MWYASLPALGVNIKKWVEQFESFPLERLNDHFLSNVLYALYAYDLKPYLEIYGIKSCVMAKFLHRWFSTGLDFSLLYGKNLHRFIIHNGFYIFVMKIRISYSNIYFKTFVLYSDAYRAFYGIELINSIHSFPEHIVLMPFDRIPILIHNLSLLECSLRIDDLQKMHWCINMILCMNGFSFCTILKDPLSGWIRYSIKFDTIWDDIVCDIIKYFSLVY